MNLFRMFQIRTILFTCCSLTLLLLSSHAIARAKQDPQESATPSFFSQNGNRSAKLKNGDEVKVVSYGRLEIVRNDGTTEKLARPRTWHQYFAVFPDPNNENSVLALGQVSDRNTGMALHRYDCKTLEHELLIRSHERLRPTQLSFNQLENGNILLISNQGVLMHFRDGKHVDRMALDGFYRDPNKMFRPIQGAVSGNRAIYFSNVAPDYSGKALRDIVVLENGKFKRLDIGNVAIGPGQLIGNQMKFMTQTGMLSVDITTGKVENIDAVDPEVDGKSLVPLKLFATRAGKLIGIFRKPNASSDKKDIEMFSDGYYTQIAELEGSHWKLISMGLDNTIRKWSNQFGEDSEGRCWITSTLTGRVIVRQPDGKYTKIDEVKEIKDFEFSRITFENKEANSELKEHVLFWAFDRPRHMIAIEELLARQPKTFANWRRIQTRTPFIPDANGVLYAISNKAGGKLLRITDGKFEYLDLPPREKFRNTGFIYITADTDDNFWLFSDQQNRSAVLEDGKWTVFEPTDTLTSKQVAIEDRLKKLDGRSDYRIGISGFFKIHFGKDRQAVFRNRQKRVAYYDGNKWHSPLEGYESGKEFARNNPFFFKDLICIEMPKQQIFGMTRENFQSLNNESDNRPWKPLSLSADDQQKLLVKNEYQWKPSSFPNGAKRKYQEGRYWYSDDGTRDRLAIALRNQNWSFLELEGTPLKGLHRIHITGVQGNLFIFGSDYSASKDQFAWLAPNVEINVTSKDLGEIGEPAAPTLAKFATVPSSQKVHLRYRVEDDPWSKWIPGNQPMRIRGIAKPGKHVVQVQFSLDHYLKVIETVDYEFTTTYSLQESIDREIARLSSNSFEERESATSKLTAIGPAVIQSLKSVIENSDTESKMRSKKIIDAVFKRFNVKQK